MHDRALLKGVACIAGHVDTSDGPRAAIGQRAAMNGARAQERSLPPRSRSSVFKVSAGSSPGTPRPGSGSEILTTEKIQFSIAKLCTLLQARFGSQIGRAH